MRAIVVESTDKHPGPDALQIAEVNTPVPSADQVLIKVTAAGVNRADLLQRQGFYPPPPGESDIIGLEVSGTVAHSVAGGPAEGTQVVALLAGGGYAEYVAAPLGQVLAVPDGTDLITAATLIEVAATVVSNFDLVGLSAGETVLIHGGSGGIGTFAIQYAKALGCRVAVTAGTADKRALCAELGADLTLDYHEDWVTGLKQATDGHGADVILDVMGASYLEANVAALAFDGRLVVIGLQGGVKGTLNIGALLNRRGTVAATSLRARPADQKAAICAAVAAKAWPMLTDGRIRPVPLTTFPLAEAARAHALVESGQHTGKVALAVTA